jgi:hypothetical protein
MFCLEGDGVIVCPQREDDVFFSCWVGHWLVYLKSLDFDHLLMHPSRLLFCFDGFLHFVWFWWWMCLLSCMFTLDIPRLESSTSIIHTPSHHAIHPPLISLLPLDTLSCYISSFPRQRY